MQDLFPLLSEICMETRALLPCAYPFWVQHFPLQEGNIPQGLFSPPLLTNIYPIHMAHTPTNLLQRLSASMEQSPLSFWKSDRTNCFFWRCCPTLPALLLILWDLRLQTTESNTPDFTGNLFDTDLHIIPTFIGRKTKPDAD